jgi:hypothetical protein
LLGGLDSLVELAKRNDNDLVTNDLVLRVALEAARDAELASAGRTISSEADGLADGMR